MYFDMNKYLYKWVFYFYIKIFENKESCYIQFYRYFQEKIIILRYGYYRLVYYVNEYYEINYFLY